MPAPARDDGTTRGGANRRRSDPQDRPTVLRSSSWCWRVHDGLSDRARDGAAPCFPEFEFANAVRSAAATVTVVVVRGSSGRR
jgi:hypothetical protein